MLHEAEGARSLEGQTDTPPTTTTEHCGCTHPLAEYHTKET